MKTNKTKPKIYIDVLLGCQDLRIMRKRWNRMHYHDSIILVSGLPRECEYAKKNLVDDLKCVYFDDDVYDTFSNAESVFRLIKHFEFEDAVIHCRLSRLHAWRFKKCLRYLWRKNPKLNVEFDIEASKQIPEAKGELFAVLIYLVPFGFLISNWVTRTFRQ